MPCPARCGLPSRPAAPCRPVSCRDIPGAARGPCPRCRERARAWARQDAPFQRDSGRRTVTANQGTFPQSSRCGAHTPACGTSPMLTVQDGPAAGQRQTHRHREPGHLSPVVPLRCPYPRLRHFAHAHRAGRPGSGTVHSGGACAISGPFRRRGVRAPGNGRDDRPAPGSCQMPA